MFSLIYSTCPAPLEKSIELPETGRDRLVMPGCQVQQGLRRGDGGQAILKFLVLYLQGRSIAYVVMKRRNWRYHARPWGRVVNELGGYVFPTLPLLIIVKRIHG